MIERRAGRGLRRVVITLLLMVVTAGVRAVDLPATFDPARDGAADVAYALSLAKAQGKRVIVDVGGEWCSWCHVLDRFIAAKQNENAALLARWPKVAGYPHLFVLDATGPVVLSQDTEALESRSTYDKARFLAFLAKGAGKLPSRAAASYGPFGLVGKPTYVF